MRGYYFSWLGKGMLALFLILNAVLCLGSFPPGEHFKPSNSNSLSSAEKGKKLLNTTSSTLVGHWKLDEGSGVTLVDHSGLGNHARLKKPNGVTWVPGMLGLALNLPGSADRFGVVPNHASLNITDALTIAAWIRPVDVSTRAILTKTIPDGYELSINRSGKIEFRFNSSTSGNTYLLQSNASYPANGNTWMHVTATFDGTIARIYLNGILDKTVTYNSPVAIRTNPSDLYIGALFSSNRWKGGLDDVRLYHGALTSAEVNTLVNGNTPPPAITLLSSPLNQAIDVPLNTTLTWNTVAGALHYSIEVSESQTFSPTVFARNNITSTQVQAQGLAAGKQYYWRVHASNNGGDGPWSQAWSFTTINLPPVIQPGAVINLQQFIASKTYQHINLAPLFSDPENAPLTYVVSSSDPAVATVAVAGNLLQIHTLKAGDASISLKASDGTQESAPLLFRTLVYPEAKVLSANNYTFSNWDANAPEGTFPDNMIFLQSDIDDPDLAKELLYPYAIPASDYAAADAGNIGFPYRNTSRTRINGLGNDGICFINTGRGRDLGGALLAVDTRNISDAKIGFTAATLAPNFRVYNIAVLCRIGTDGQWQPVFTELEQPLVYESKAQVDSSQENLVGYLPSAAIGQEYVQVLFKYYYTGVQRSGTGGARTQIRLDDISAVQDVRNPVTPPAAVQLTAPLNNEQNVALSPDFTWVAAQNAGTYKIQVATDNQFSAPVIDQTLLGTTTYKPTNPLNAATVYYWRVRAINSAGEGPWSGVFSFRTISNTGVTYQLAINEVMSSNTSTIADEDGAFSDWIELVNYGTTPIDLQGFGLSDSYATPLKWIFPAKIMAPGEFLLIWASSKNKTNPSLPLHTNFAIGADGEEVLLTAPDGTLVDEMLPFAMTANLSRGRLPDGTGAFQSFSTATPGVTNQGGTANQTLAIPVFSVAPGVYTTSLSLSLTHPEPGVTIRYTLDGSEPTATSPVYQQPLQLSDRSGQPNAHSTIPTNFISGSRGWVAPSGLIRKGTIVRAKAFKNNSQASEIVTGTYIVLLGRQYTLPIISVVTAHENLFSNDQGIYVPGDNYVTGNDGTGNYEQRGDAWERPGSIEFFGPGLSFQQNIGIRINGDFSRRFPQKSLRILASSTYGKSTLDYPVFPNYTYNNVKRWVLRNSGNDWGHTMFKDAATHMLAKHILHIQGYRPTVVFLNGEYWGIHNIRERSDKYYLATHFGVDPANLDYLSRNLEIEEGDAVHYQEMLDYIQNTNLSSNSNFDGVRNRMDVDDFINYYSVEIYTGNNDWPQSNIDYWRARVPFDPNAPKGQDGRWRWIFADTDAGFDDPAFNSIEWCTALKNPYKGEEWPNVIVRNLLTNQQFKNDFINRIADHLNTAFLPSRVLQVIDSIAPLVEPEMPEHIQRWSRPSSMNSWRSDVQKLRDFAAARPAYVRQHLMQKFSLPNQFAVTLNVSDKTHGSIKINSLVINSNAVGVNAAQPYPWQGIYFNGVPVTLKALANPGYKFDYWQVGNQVMQNEEININLTSNLAVTAHFIPTSGSGPKPILLSPANNATNVAVQPTTLSWNALTGASGYRLQVSLNAGFSTTILDRANISTTSEAVSGLANNTVYYWRVRATLSNGDSDWSDTWSFRTVPLPTSQFSLNVTVNGSGTVAKSPNQTAYASGTSVQLTATPAAGYQFSGWSGDASGTTNPLSVVMNDHKNITATFSPVSTLGVTGFNLINASADNVIRPLVSGDVINLASLPTRKINIQALTNPSVVGSVGFNLSGQQTKVRSDDSGPTYSLFGDTNGDYNSWTPTTGSYTLSARTFTGSNGSGTPSAFNTITFSVIDQSGATARMANPGNNAADENPETIAVVAYPVPFNDVLVLHLRGNDASEQATVTLSTIMGKTVYRKEIKVDEDRKIVELNGLAKLPKGMYLLQLQTNEKPVVLKVLKE